MRWKPVDVIAAAITLTLCFVLAGTVIDAVLINQEFNEGRARRIEEVVMALIALLSVYIGNKMRNDE